ncbi:hypothetical protein H0X06_02520 [Candidatus Dependentiae bacterium]|nr:hypothetical protein [Candidatus Dependentiae bacterium]
MKKFSFKQFVGTVSGVLLLSSTILSTAEPIEVVLPAPTGTFSVGTKAFELCDCSRTQLRGSGKRRWMVQAWYPAEHVQDSTFDYMPETLPNSLVNGVKVRAHAQPNAALKKDGRFPLIIFQHGFGEVRQSYTILCEELASHGFIVLSLDQPYNASFIRFSSGDHCVPTAYDIWKLTNDREYRYSFFDECMKESIGDILYILSHLTTITSKYFNSQIQTNFITLIGHSFGGNVAHTLGFKNPLIKAIVDIDSKVTEKEIYGHIGVPENNIKKPVLFIRSNQYQDDVKNLRSVPNANVIDFNVQHSAFRDIAYLVNYIPSLRNQTFFAKLWNWFWLKGPLFDPVDTSIENYSVANWFSTYRSTITSWLSNQQKTVS